MSRARIEEAYAAIAAADRPEVWITLRPRREVLAEAAAIDPALPLAGRTLAVKDNIDVAGLPTTAGCPSYAYVPQADAPAVARLRAAGAVVLGKTNLDQFATGLVGTRSPYGAVRDWRRPTHISGGSSSGSAVAVALGAADLALGTDTAGSGRVPAAFQGLVGVKPTRGLVPVRGVVPACRSLDCVTVFATSVTLAEQALWTMAGIDGDDDLSRAWPADAPLAAPPTPVVAVPAPGQLAPFLSVDALAAFDAAVARLVAVGATLLEVDLEAFLSAGRMLYEGAFVAERYAAVGDFIASGAAGLDPTVAAIIGSAALPAAHELASDVERLGALRLRCDAIWQEADALLLPTTTHHPTLAEVAADPIGVNARLGTFTNATNLLDRSALALPAGEADGGQFGVTLLGSAFGDRVIADLAGRFLDEPPLPAGPPGTLLLVVGAHRSGQPLNHQLTDLGARFVAVAQTSPDYRLVALNTTPPKPGLVRVTEDGAAIEGELWELPTAGLGSFLAALPAPMSLGPVTLADGRAVVGFGCDHAAVSGAPDITAHGSWPAYLVGETV